MRCDLVRCHQGCVPAHCNGTRSARCGLQLPLHDQLDTAPCTHPTEDWQPLRPRPTKLEVRGHVHLLPPLPSEVLALSWYAPALARLVASGTLRAAMSLWAPQSLWEQAALAARTEWQVAVLGSSTTSGCGADENMSAWEDCSSSPSRACVVGGSWSRAFSDESQRRAAMWRRPGKLVPPHVYMYAKNAVSASWFGHCATRKLPPSARVVLIEVSANAWNGVASMLARVRQAVPRAVVIFVIWPSKSMLMHMIDVADEEAGIHSGGTVEGVDAILSAARAQGADVLNMGEVLAQLLSHRVPFSQLYALRGLDHVHPNPAAHILIGQCAAMMVHQRLMMAAGGAPCGATGTSAQSTYRGITGTSRKVLSRNSPASINRSPEEPTSHASAAVNGNAISFAELWQASTPSAYDSEWEQCYDDAQAIPLVLNASVSSSGGASVRDTSVGGWRLVDEGGAKRVRKAGWVSTMPGDTLRIGPIGRQTRPPMPFAACAAARLPLRASLGYLLNRQPTQGALLLSCDGSCQCVRDTSRYALENFPFPLVNTHLARAANPHLRLQNVSVTDETEFTIWQTVGSPCFVRVTHVGQPPGMDSITPRRSIGQSTPSRVRIDSLSLRALSPLDMAYLAEKTLKKGVVEAPRAFGRAWAAANCSQYESAAACNHASGRGADGEMNGGRATALPECARAARWEALVAAFARVDAGAMRKAKTRAHGPARSPSRHH